MSLINDALLDLQDQQRKENLSVSFEKIEAQVNRPNTRFGIVAVGLLAVTTLMYLGLRDNTIQEDFIAHNVQLEKTPSEKLEAQERAPILVAKNETPEKILSTESAEAQEKAKAREQAVQVATMITKLEIATARNRLSLPKGDNALYYLAEIKKLDPNNVEIVNFEQKVKERFIAQLDGAIEKQDKKRVDLLLARAPLFQLDQSYLEEAKSRSKRISSRNSITSPSFNKQALAIDSTERRESVVTKSLAFLDKQAQQEANALIQQGRRRDAEQLLESFISENPMAVDTSVQLFNMYLEEGNTQKAEIFVANLSKNHPTERYFRARIAKLQYGEKLAISLLEKYSPEKELAYLYQSFLAGLYQQQKQYRQAQELYKTLLQGQPDNRQFLLGFGLSSDALNESHQARWAYEKIHQLGHSNPSVMQYIQKRLKSLAGNQLVENQLW